MEQVGMDFSKAGNLLYLVGEEEEREG